MIVPVATQRTIVKCALFPSRSPPLTKIFLDIAFALHATTETLFVYLQSRGDRGFRKHIHILVTYCETMRLFDAAIDFQLLVDLKITAVFVVGSRLQVVVYPYAISSAQLKYTGNNPRSDRDFQE